MDSLEEQNTSNLSPAFQRLADDYMMWRLQNTPEYASFVGIHDYDDQLDDMSLEAYRHRRDRCQELLRRSNTLQKTLTLPADVVNLRILQHDLTTFIDGFPFGGFLMPFCYLSGVHLDFELLVSWMVLETTEDYKKLLSRIEKLPVQLQQIQTLMQEGVNRRIMSHLSSLKGVRESLARFVVTCGNESPLWKYFETFPDTIAEDDATNIQKRARTLITEQVSVSFAELCCKLEEYEEMTRPEIAVTTLPKGNELYQQLIRFHTTTNMTPEEIHDLGKTEVERIQKQMAEVISELGLDMPPSEFSKMIQNDPKFYHKNGEDLLEDIRRLVQEVIAPKLSDVFNRVPKTELRVVSDPSPQGTLAFHQPASLDGSRPGLYKVNTQLYHALPKYDILTLSLHEGNPGHHLHSAFLLESPDIPLFRKVYEDRNYQQAPSRFPFYTAFLEGWALYAETLGFDMGLFNDPYDRYGHYSNEMYRACRLVVDTGLHCFGWTRERAVAYMKQHTALSPANIENEVNRYIALPGQALGYKIGQLKITQLRKKATSTLGKRFNLKEFHDVILSASGPLEILEEEVNAWLTAKIG